MPVRCVYEYATFGGRLVAAIIDRVIIWTLSFPLSMLAAAAEEAGPPSYPPFLVLLLPFAYHFASTAIWGKTIGKSALGIHVVSVDGSKPGLDQAFMREVIGKFVSTIVLYLGFIWAAFNSEGKTWHDWMAGTRVVYRRR